MIVGFKVDPTLTIALVHLLLLAVYVFTIFTYIDDIHMTAYDITKGLIGACQTSIVQLCWAFSRAWEAANKMVAGGYETRIPH